MRTPSNDIATRSTPKPHQQHWHHHGGPRRSAQGGPGGSNERKFRTACAADGFDAPRKGGPGNPQGGPGGSLTNHGPLRRLFSADVFQA